MLCRLAAALLVGHASGYSGALASLRSARAIDLSTNRELPLLDGLDAKARTLVYVLPQAGEFDSCEACELLSAVRDDLEAADISLRVVAIGDGAAGTRFAAANGLPDGVLRMDPEASLHRELDLHRGPDWSWPEFVSDDALRFVLSTLPGGAPADAARLRPVADAWLRYLAMCAGIAAPGTLPEILRGYFGDRSAPERLAPDCVVKAGFVEIGPGVGPVKLGPIRYTNAWAEDRGYQRPVELATVRLRHMVEVLTNWDAYVSDARFIDFRGATYLFEGDELLYEYRHRGVLTYSATMARPLTFLAPFIGAKALNPLGLGDDGVAATPS